MPTAQPADRRPSRGVLYTVTDDVHFLKEARINIERLKALGPGEAIAMLSNLPEAAEVCRELGVRLGLVSTPAWVSRPSRHIKTQAARLSPFDITMMIDGDVVPLRPWTGVFDLVIPGKISIALNDAPIGRSSLAKNSPELAWMLRRYPSETPMYNAGVMLWQRGPEVRSVFHRWHRQWRRWGDVDQLAMVRANFPIHEIPQIYNDQMQDSETAAFDRGTIFWHHWSAKNAIIWTEYSRQATRLKKMQTQWWRRAAHRFWRKLPTRRTSVRWLPCDSAACDGVNA